MAGPAAEPRAEARPTLFGLDEAETEMLGALFAEAAASRGLDGAAIFASLREGATLGQALGLPPRLGEALYARAHGWFNAGRHDRAEALFRALCVLDGRDADHWVGYGVCLRMREARQEAGLAFATAAAIRPAWAVPHFHGAAVAIADERWDEARAHLQAFGRHAGTAVPEAMRGEAARLAAALNLRAGRVPDRPGP